MIECVGNEICAGLAAYANGTNGTMWNCDDCAQGATSGQTLAALPLALAKHPDVVLILTGSYDVDDPNWSGACNVTGDPSKQTCANITSIIKQLQAAHVPYILGSIPSWQEGTVAAQLAPHYDQAGPLWVDGNIFFFDHSANIIVIYDQPGQYADFYPVVLDTGIGPTGIDPNDQGYAAMLAVVQPLIQQLTCGRRKVKRTRELISGEPEYDFLQPCA